MKIQNNRDSASMAITKVVWQWGRYKPSPPSTKELHGLPNLLLNFFKNSQVYCWIGKLVHTTMLMQPVIDNCKLENFHFLAIKVFNVFKGMSWIFDVIKIEELQSSTFCDVMMYLGPKRPKVSKPHYGADVVNWF